MYQLRVDLEDFYGTQRFAKYSKFAVNSSSRFYNLYVTGYQGDAGEIRISFKYTIQILTQFDAATRYSY